MWPVASFGENFSDPPVYSSLQCLCNPQTGHCRCLEWAEATEPLVLGMWQASGGLVSTLYQSVFKYVIWVFLDTSVNLFSVYRYHCVSIQIHAAAELWKLATDVTLTAVHWVVPQGAHTGLDHGAKDMANKWKSGASSKNIQCKPKFSKTHVSLCTHMCIHGGEEATWVRIKTTV